MGVSMAYCAAWAGICDLGSQLLLRFRPFREELMHS